jgi:hypothetical protein
MTARLGNDTLAVGPYVGMSFWLGTSGWRSDALPPRAGHKK